MSTIRTAEDLEQALVDALGWQDGAAWEEIENAIRGAQSYRDAGVLTRDRGVVLTLANGAQFQLTVVRSERPHEQAFDCPECGAEDEEVGAFAKHLVTAHGWEMGDALAEVAEQQDRAEGR